MLGGDVAGLGRVGHVHRLDGRELRVEALALAHDLQLVAVSLATLISRKFVILIQIENLRNNYSHGVGDDGVREVVLVDGLVPEPRAVRRVRVRQ